MKEASEQWLKAAEDDLHVVAMIASEDYLTHMVAFHAQQCIEKSLKAIIEEYELGLLPTGKPTLAEAKEFYECAKSIHDQVMAKL